MNERNIRKGDVVFYAQCLEPVGIFEVLELTIRTVEDTWFVGLEKKDKQALLFNNTDIDKCIFFDRNKALKKVKTAQANCKKVILDETDSE